MGGGSFGLFCKSYSSQLMDNPSLAFFGPSLVIWMAKVPPKVGGSSLGYCSWDGEYIWCVGEINETHLLDYKTEH